MIEVRLTDQGLQGDAVEMDLKVAIHQCLLRAHLFLLSFVGLSLRLQAEHWLVDSELRYYMYFWQGKKMVMAEMPIGFVSCDFAMMEPWRMQVMELRYLDGSDDDLICSCKACCT